MWFTVLKHEAKRGFQGAVARVEGFETAKKLAENAARNQALRGHPFYEYRVCDPDGRVRYRAPSHRIEVDGK